MKKRFQDVARFRDRLRTAPMPDLGLSPEGARAALDAALDALDDASLAAESNRAGTPFDRACFIAAGTVATAPIEWCALLLGHGSEVVLKQPSAAEGLAPWLAEEAQRLGLPLTSSVEPDTDAPLVIAMGRDETIDTLRAGVRGRFLGFGHRFGVAWSTDPGLVADEIALDLALHDSRGCMSPVALFTTQPLSQALDALAAALERAQSQIPRGRCGAAELATIRARSDLARWTGTARVGTDWAVHGLLPRYFAPEALPRCLQVLSVASRDEALEVLRPYARWLGTVGDDDGNPWFDARVCPIGQMQRPPLDRLHDGVDWRAALLR